MNVNASANVLAACKPWTRTEIAARAAHDSPAYQEALAALAGGADRDMRIVEGV